MVTAVAALTLLAGCSSRSDGSASATPATVTATVTVTAEPSSTASASPSSKASSVEPNVGSRALKLGQWREGSGVRSKVISFTQASDTNPPSYLSGDSSAEGALVKLTLCERPSETKPAPISAYDWYAYDSSGGEYTVAGSSWDEWPPLPHFTYESKLRPGTCAGGWMLFNVPKSVKITKVSYGSGADAAAEWVIK